MKCNQVTISVSQATKKPPVSLACGHTVCRTCLDSLQMRQCPFDSTLIGVSSLDALPVNTALLQLIGSGEVPARCFGLNPSMCNTCCPSRYRAIPTELQPDEVEPYRLALRLTQLLLKICQRVKVSMNTGDITVIITMAENYFHMATNYLYQVYI